MAGFLVSALNSLKELCFISTLQRRRGLKGQLRGKPSQRPAQVDLPVPPATEKVNKSLSERLVRVRLVRLVRLERVNKSLSLNVWPTSGTGWSVKAVDLPAINDTHILDHLLKTGKAVPGQDRVVVTQKPLRRGYDFFWGGYVHDVRVHSGRDGRVCVEGKCWASQRMNMKYSQKIVFKKGLMHLPAVDEEEDENVDSAESWTVEEVMEDWTITFAECSPCVAGQHGGYCQHVFALLMVVEAYAGKDVSLPGEQNVTSGKQRLGPRARNIELQRVMSSTIERAKPDEERRGKAISSTLHEARGPKMQEMRHDATARLKCRFPAGCRMAGILPGQENFPQRH